MFRKSIVIAIVTIVISLFTTSSFAQRAIPGQMSGLLPGASGSSGNSGSITRTKASRLRRSCRRSGHQRGNRCK